MLSKHFRLGQVTDRILRSSFVASIMFLLLLSSAASAAPGGRFVGGADAIKGLGDRIGRVAANHGKDARELRALFRRDKSLKVDPSAASPRLLYTDDSQPRVISRQTPYVRGASIPIVQHSFCKIVSNYYF